MKTQALLLTVMAATGFGLVAAAQDTGREPGADDLIVLPAFESIDVNEDGMITASETQGLARLLREKFRLAFRFGAVDKNADGQINHQEYLAYDGELKEHLGIG